MTPGALAFGPLLRELRLRANVSQELLAERATISKQAVSMLERGVRRAPYLYTLGLLMDALQLDAQERSQLAAAAERSSATRTRYRKTLADTAPAAASNVPAVATSFRGRDRDCAAVSALLEPGHCVTICGTGGVGKTRVAIEIARAVPHRFDGGVWYVELARFTDGHEIVDAIAAATGTREEPTRPLEDSLLAELSGRHALLVLDNAEHVIDECSRVVERIVREAPAVTIVCTSREPLRIGGEHVHRLDPLPLPNPADPALGEAPAIRLFIDRAQSAGAHIDEVRDLQAIASICARLDAIPLAIELAAARAPLMSPASIELGLDDRFRLLTRGYRGAETRHQTLAAVLAWGIALLSPAEQKVFERVAVWAGTWTLDDAIAVAGDAALERWAIVDAVALLVDRSLIVAAKDDGNETRFRLLQTTRAYALDGLAVDERARIDLLHARRLCANVERASDALRGGDGTPFRDLDVHSLRQALRWTLTLGNNVSLGCTIAGHAALYWDYQGSQREGLAWIDQALAALDDDACDAAIVALLGRSRLARRLSLFSAAYDAGAAALQIAGTLGDARHRMTALMLMGLPAARLGRHDEARRLLRESAELREELADASSMLAARCELAFTVQALGYHAEARDQLTALIALFHERGDERVAMGLGIDLAEAEFSLGHTAAAIACARDALAVARSLDASRYIGAALQNIAAYQLDAGDVASAVRSARDSLELALARGYGAQTAHALGHLADALACNGNMHEAALLCGYVDALLDRAAIVREATEIRGYERLTARFSAAFTGDERARALRAGAELTEEDALAIAFEATAALI